MPVSVLILTRNDERDIGGCLESVACSDDVHVLDSSSEDKTLEISRASGAYVTQRSSESAGLLGATLKAFNFKHPWVLILGAGDRLTRGLQAELSLIGAYSGPEIAYRIRQREIPPRKPSRGASPIRLLRWSSMADRKEIGEAIAVDGDIGELVAPFDHVSSDGKAPSGQGEDSRRMKIVTWLSCASLVGAVFFFSWLPLPRLSAQVPMPAFIGKWVDSVRNENLRTAVPFVLLGLVAGRALVKKSAVWSSWLWAWAAMILAASLAEAGQHFLPARCCDPRDIAWAAAGGAAGLLVMFAGGWSRRLVQRLRGGSMTSPV